MVVIFNFKLQQQTEPSSFLDTVDAALDFFQKMARMNQPLTTCQGLQVIVKMKHYFFFL